MKTNKILAITASAVLVFTLAFSSSAEITAAKQLGDVNGDGVIDTADALEIMQYSVGKKTEFSAERTLGVVLDREKTTAPYTANGDLKYYPVELKEYESYDYKSENHDKLMSILLENNNSVDVAEKYGIKKNEIILSSDSQTDPTRKLYFYFELTAKDDSDYAKSIYVTKVLNQNINLLVIKTESNAYAFEITEKQFDDAITCFTTEYQYLGKSVPV